MKLQPLLLLLILLAGLPVAAQQDTTAAPLDLQETLFEILENDYANIDESADYADELEELWQTSSINLNDLSPEVAFNILHLTDYQYYQLQLYIELYGELVSVYEIAAIEGFDQNLAERLAKIVQVLPRKRAKTRVGAFFQQSQHTLLMRYRQVVEPQAGYRREEGTGYLGNPMRLCWKYAMSSGDHFAMALAGEKDAGEQLFRGRRNRGLTTMHGTST